MLERQTKNIIKVIIAVVISVLVGEGILGLGFFWPFLLILIEWSGIYWFSFVLGILISAIYHLPVGLPSLFLVVVTGGLSLFFSSRKETSGVMLVVALVANLVFDKVFGLGWNWWEIPAVTAAWWLADRWFEKTESIKINY